MTIRRLVVIGGLGAAMLAAACGEKKADVDSAAAQGVGTGATARGAAASAATGGAQTPDPGGRVIDVQMMTDEQGNNRFDPGEVEAKPGDVLRFTLKSGVHNVDFLPDSNAGRSGLPAASPLLQLPGQTHDIKVSFAKGHYYFQCDPHAALGMKGRLEVE